MNNTFQIYRSSAGSGKTRTLAKEYLKLALKSKHDYFRHVLAVTFTNKATQEMKDRILYYLDSLANGRSNDLAEELKAELNLDTPTFIQHSQEVQSAILHTYSQFSISTIDAFFQRVIRSFTRESGLIGDYRLEIDQDAVLEEVVDNLIDELGSNNQLTRWVVDFAKENLENDKAWDVRHSLQTFAGQIFREEFKGIEDELKLATAKENFFQDLITELKKIKFQFINTVKSKAIEALDLMHAHGLSASDFKYGGGAYNFFQKISKINRVKDFDETAKGKRAEKEFQDTKNWPDKATPNQGILVKLAADRLLPLLNEILNNWHNQYQKSVSAEVVLNNFYAFGLIADIARKLGEYKAQNNLMLLADAPKFLNGIIQDSDTPFIYEKVGSFFRNYLIDEFQDTSGYQWKNFLPLLKNGIDQGYKSLVVGDVKQAIYRWRGGDLKLLQTEVQQSVGSQNTGITELDTNYRSAVTVVNFNNLLFKDAATLISKKVNHTLPADAFTDVAQKISKVNHQGFVKISFIEEDQEDKWQEQALRQIPLNLELLQEKGIPLKDIAILVRKNSEGQKIASYLMQHKISPQARPGFRYDVISNESLRLDGAASVNLLLGAMKYLLNTEDAIARAQLAFEYAKLHTPNKIMSEVFTVSDAFFEQNLPEAFTKEKQSLRKLPLFELTETLISIFKLGNNAGELTFLLAFQDVVLDFYSRERNNLGAFIDWWEANKHNKSIQVSGEIDAVQILSIHKSKGLQFKYVIIPFCAWNMDHDTLNAPLLWVKSNHHPFNQAGYLPVAYSTVLQETYFSEFYKEEFTRTHLDNLNLLYVAFTRAELALIVTAPHPQRVRGFSVANILYDSITNNPSLANQWNEATQVWQNGALTAVESQPVHNNQDNLHLSTYPVGSWREKLVIRQTAKGFFDNTHVEVLAKINYGIYMHTVLSRIQYHHQLNHTLNLIVHEGIITEQDRQPLAMKLDELMKNEQIANWFSTEWNVKTEIPILMPDGSENRIDRLLIKDKRAIVVDFKTGEPTPKDQRQVLDYINILRQMNFIDVEGYLLYLRENNIVSVTTGRAKPVKKKIDNQLGLY